MRNLITILMCVLFWSCSQKTEDPEIIVNPKEPETQNDVFLFDLGLFCCKCSDSTAIERTWDYPVKPGTEEWKNFHDNDGIVNALQIPEDILVSLSTEELTEICLGYPFLHYALYFDRYNDGLDKLFNDFNGVRELFKREDVSKELIGWYDCQIKNLTIWNREGFDTQKGMVSIKTPTLEALLSRVSSDYKDVLRSLVNGYEEKLMYSDSTSYKSYLNFSARAHIIQKMCGQCLDEIPEKERNYLLEGLYENDQTKAIINKLSYQLIK